MRPEIKFLAAFGMATGVGFLMGSTMLGVVVGTCLGLVWGYGETMLMAKPNHRKTSKRASSSRKGKSSRRRK